MRFASSIERGWRYVERPAKAAVLGLLLLPAVASADFVNGNFENGLTGWSSTAYTNNAISTFPPTSIADLGLATLPSGANLNVVVSGATKTLEDIMLNGAGTPLRVPYAGGKSALINLITDETKGFVGTVTRSGNNGADTIWGNTWTTDQTRASSLQQTVTVQAGDYSATDGKLHLRFKWAAVLDDPSNNHNDNEKPYYAIELRNLTAPRAQQLFFSFRTSTNPTALPFQSATSTATASSRPYDYADWQSVDVVLDASKVAIGDQVILEIVASGCSKGGHEGHAYVDTVGFGMHTLTLKAAVSPAGDPGKFTLQYAVGANPLANAPNGVDLGDGGSSDPISLDTGASVNIAEIAGTGTSLANYVAGAIVCTGTPDSPTITGTTSGTFTMPDNDVVCTFSNVAVPKLPALSVAKTHSGSFTGGSAANVYAVTVSNVGAGPTAGTVTVTDTAPAGMVVIAMGGAGWTCTTLPTCTRSDALPAGSSYPAIAVTVNITAASSTQLVNAVAASGGGAPSTATAADPTNVVIAAVNVPTMGWMALLALVLALAGLGGAQARRSRN